MTSVAADIDRAAAELRTALGDRLLLPTDAGFAAATVLWNGAARSRPALIARCLDPDEVALAVTVAHRHHLPLTVRSAGHDWAGRALRAGALAVDLTGLRSVEVDPDSLVLTAAGGATAADVIAAGRPHDLVVATGTVRAVGMAGLTLAGGYGPLCGRYGLALDNLLGAEVVLPDGRRVTAGPDHDAELYWALRGGGGNFGVVTSLRYRAHRLPAVLAGMILFPLDQAAAVLRGYREVLADAPDELTVIAGFIPGPQGEPLVFVFPTWAGADLGAGQRAIDRLRALGTPVVDGVAPLPYDDVLRMFDSSMADDNHYLLRTRWLPVLSDGAVEEIVDAARRVSSPFSMMVMHHFHGAASRVGPADTAFGLRTDHLLAEVIAVWAPAQDPAPHRDWADRVDAGLARHALPGGYPNLLAPTDTDRVRLAYGVNYERLARARRRYDPGYVLSAVPTLPAPPDGGPPPG